MLLQIAVLASKDITTPLKPSQQRQFILQVMEQRAEKDDARWEQVLENMDLLFAKVGEIDNNQLKIETQFEMSVKVMEQVLKD